MLIDLLLSGSLKATICPYAIANIVLSHLKKLNGSLFTSSLYQYFMTMAGTPLSFHVLYYAMNVCMQCLLVRRLEIVFGFDGVYC